MTTKAARAEQADLKGTERPTFLDTLQKIRIVVRAAQQHSLRIEKQCGVSGAQLWVMQELHETPGLRVGDIANRLAIHQTTASNLVRVLEKRAYVVKARDPEDQRVVRLVLSEQGRGLLAQAPKPARGLLPDSLRQMDNDGLRHLNEGLQRLLNSMEAVNDEYGMQPLSFTM
jgi:DNA-binding MarR family transcriptional regulator